MFKCDSSPSPVVPGCRDVHLFLVGCMHLLMTHSFLFQVYVIILAVEVYFDTIFEYVWRCGDRKRHVWHVNKTNNIRVFSLANIMVGETLKCLSTHFVAPLPHQPIITSWIQLTEFPFVESDWGSGTFCICSHSGNRICDSLSCGSFHVIVTCWLNVSHEERFMIAAIMFLEVKQMIFFWVNFIFTTITFELIFFWGLIKYLFLIELKNVVQLRHQLVKTKRCWLHYE